MYTEKLASRDVDVVFWIFFSLNISSVFFFHGFLTFASQCGECEAHFTTNMLLGFEKDKAVELYGSANNPQIEQKMIPDRKWSRTGNDPHIGPQMIPIKK